MNNSLLIGKLIYSNISQCSDIVDKVGDNIYPIVAPMEVNYPFIVYTRVNAYPNTVTKDAWVEDIVSFQVTVVSDKYIESAEIANKVRDIFENCMIYDSDLTISNIHMTACTEAYSEDAYTQTLNFNCEAN